MNNEHIPEHVALIPDGNRRWAKQRGEKPWVGHEVAAQNLEEILRVAADRGVKCLSLWGSSRENLEKRPLQEKAALLRIYEESLGRLMNSEELVKNDVRVRVIGRWREQFPAHLKKKLEDAIEKTAHHKTFNLTLCLAYSGDDEMHSAIQSIVGKGVAAAAVTPEMIKAHLMTHDLPPVDYLIRTGGEPHLSVGFMMWEIANAQLFFTDDLCPDFTGEKFGEALDEFASRARRHGA